MRIRLKKNDICMNKQIQSRNSENLEATNSMIARTNKIANARLKLDSIRILSLSWSIKPNAVHKVD